jgi:hypothetical protein
MDPAAIVLKVSLTTYFTVVSLSSPISELQNKKIKQKHKQSNPHLFSVNFRLALQFF